MYKAVDGWSITLSTHQLGWAPLEVEVSRERFKLEMGIMIQS